MNVLVQVQLTIYHLIISWGLIRWLSLVSITESVSVLQDQDVVVSNRLSLPVHTIKIRHTHNKHPPLPFDQPSSHAQANICRGATQTMRFPVSSLSFGGQRRHLVCWQPAINRSTKLKRQTSLVPCIIQCPIWQQRYVYINLDEQQQGCNSAHICSHVTGVRNHFIIEMTSG